MIHVNDQIELIRVLVVARHPLRVEDLGLDGDSRIEVVGLARRLGVVFAKAGSQRASERLGHRRLATPSHDASARAGHARFR